MAPTTAYSTNRETYLFQRENFELALPDFRWLLENNHGETGVFDKDFDPDFDKYFYLERAKALAFFTIRTEEQRHAIGYNMFYIEDVIYQKEMIAATQANLYIDKAHRGIGLPFLRFCDDSLIEMGVQVIFRQATAKLDISPIYKRMGYTFVEKVFMKGCLDGE